MREDGPPPPTPSTGDGRRKRSRARSGYRPRPRTLLHRRPRPRPRTLAWNEELRGRVRADEPRKDGASGDLGFREDQVSEDISRPQRPNSSPNSWDSEVRRSALTTCCTCLSDSSNSPTGSPWWMCSPIPLVDLGGRGCRHGPGSRNTTDPPVVQNSHKAGNSNRRREGAHSRSGRRRRIRSCDRASWWSSGFYPIGKSRPARRVRTRVFSVSAPPVSSMLKSP